MPAGLWAQTQPFGMPFQQADSLAAGRGGRGGAGNSIPIPRGEMGKPFSATATTQTSQTFLDGTHVNQTTTVVQYRDGEGRVRTETSEPAKIIMIRDPVAGVTYKLDPVSKTAVIMPRIPVAAGVVYDGFGEVEAPVAAGGRGGRGGRGGAAPGSYSDGAQLNAALARLNDMLATMRAKSDPNNSMEDLGTMIVNAVPTHGTRVTTVVPVGAIGNDREFRSVTERWFSPDLNLLIKSVSTDPRFGTTTYELTNISLKPPDPSLFRVPADYKQPPVPTSPIEAIEFHGLSRVPLETVKAMVLSKVGDLYNEEALRRDVTALWNTNRFSDVQLNKEPGPHGGIVVRFVLTERP